MIFSVGVMLNSKLFNFLDFLIKCVDIFLYRVKENGRN